MAELGAGEQRHDHAGGEDEEGGDRAEPDQHDPEQRRGQPKRLARRPFWSSSVNTGTKAADSAALANRFATRLGTRKAIVNAEAGPLVPK